MKLRVADLEIIFLFLFNYGTFRTDQIVVSYLLGLFTRDMSFEFRTFITELR